MATVTGPGAIARVRPGQRSLPAASWNAVADAVEGAGRLGVQGAPGALVGLGVECVLLADTGAAGADWLACELAETGERLDVLKPPLLRPSLTSRGGITYTYSGPQARIADDGSETESQVIVEAYLAGDEIIARPHVAANGAIVWMDSSARAWAKESS